MPFNLDLHEARAPELSLELDRVNAEIMSFYNNHAGDLSDAEFDDHTVHLILDLYQVFSKLTTIGGFIKRGALRDKLEQTRADIVTLLKKVNYLRFTRPSVASA